MTFVRHHLSDGLFAKFRDLVHSQTGVFLMPEDRELLSSRLARRLRHCRFATCGEYFSYLENDQSGQELGELLNCIASSFSRFFRGKDHFDYLAGVVLPGFHDRSGNKVFRAWSAVCGAGEESYSLAIVLKEFQAANPGFRFTINATDISSKVLAQARQGVYNLDRLADMPKDLLRRYFRRGTGPMAGFFKVKAEMLQAVRFQRFSLAGRFPGQGGFDLVFCRNAMLYFSEEFQQELLVKLHRCLRPGGHLMVGQRESLPTIGSSFKRVGPSAYQK
ncbi:MAG: protein-glutamate O-methyltransferase CheR [Thermodesulfobacteriota bacterium]